MQLSLCPSDLSPLPTDRWHYVPSLLNRPGELDALREASPTVWERMVPLLHVAPKRRAEEKPFRADTVRDWIKAIRAAVGERVFYLDVRGVNPRAPVLRGTAQFPLLRYLFEEAQRFHMCFVPVAWVGKKSTSSHIGLVAPAAQAGGRGVALRFAFADVVLSAGASHEEILLQCLHDLGCAISEADLLLDLGFLDPDVEHDPADLAGSINTLAAIGNWRSLVLLGSSMPATLRRIKEGTVGSIPRLEWILWNQLEEQAVKRFPAFGDYAVQHPLPPGSGGPGMRRNIRYTTEDETIIARALGVFTESGNEQYQALCAQLAQDKHFSGSHYSWGDAIIAGCATGDVDPGSQRMWRGAGTSHHLQFVTDQIQQIHVAHF